MPHKNKKLLVLSFFTFSILGFTLKAQEKITFIASDKLIVTADLYLANDTLPYMILCHDQKSSRGEYADIAKKFNKLGFNCLAIDMRAGGTCNNINNETTSLAELKKSSNKPADGRLDINAAMVYAENMSNKKIILVGSGYSASLALDIGATDPRVSSVLAFSPGDYVKVNTKKDFPGLADKPVFVASSKTESADVKKYIAEIPKEKLVQFIPATQGVHGSAALLKTDSEYHNYWIAILMFIRQIP